MTIDAIKTRIKENPGISLTEITALVNQLGWTEVNQLTGSSTFEKAVFLSNSVLKEKYEQEIAQLKQKHEQELKDARTKPVVQINTIGDLRKYLEPIPSDVEIIDLNIKLKGAYAMAITTKGNQLAPVSDGLGDVKNDEYDDDEYDDEY